MDICQKFLKYLPSFEWFIIRYYGESKVTYLLELANNGESDKLDEELNNIWFYLPDDIFNILVNPKGWNEFLMVISQ